MKVVRTAAEVRAALKGRVAFVPTMGAFHEGHISLLRAGKENADTLVCSLFVNPTQFGPGEDYTRYPRDEERDAQMAQGAGVDVLFAPSVEEMYSGSATVVSVKGVSELWEGSHRPGHFDGVATIVCKLFNTVGPCKAIFGLKDLQQCAVVRRMVSDLKMPINLQFCPTLREPDGLAMSSRNVYLSPEERAKAPLMYKELQSSASRLLSAGDASQTSEILDEARQTLERAAFAVDYFALVDTASMDLREVGKPGDSIIVAAKIGKTRLIDNVQLSN